MTCLWKPILNSVAAQLFCTSVPYHSAQVPHIGTRVKILPRQHIIRYRPVFWWTHGWWVNFYVNLRVNFESSPTPDFNPIFVIRRHNPLSQLICNELLYKVRCWALVDHFFVSSAIYVLSISNIILNCVSNVFINIS